MTTDNLETSFVASKRQPELKDLGQQLLWIITLLTRESKRCTEWCGRDKLQPLCLREAAIDKMISKETYCWFWDWGQFPLLHGCVNYLKGMAGCHRTEHTLGRGSGTQWEKHPKLNWKRFWSSRLQQPWHSQSIHFHTGKLKHVQSILSHQTMVTCASKLTGYSLARLWLVLISTLAWVSDVLSE